MPEPDPGVTPVAPAGNGGEPSNAPNTQPTQPNGSEPVTNSGGGNGEQTVPFSRFQEVNDKAKAADERAAKAEQELEAARQSQQTPSNDDDVDPDVENLITKTLEKKGYVKKEDVQSAVNAAENRRQYTEDVNSLTGEYAKSSVPFKIEDVRQYAKDNGINITNKSSLRAAYRDMNSEKLIEAAQNAAVTAFKEGTGSQAERPGTSGASAPEEPEVHGIKNRIHAARTRLQSA